MPSSTLRNATDAWTNGDKPSRNYADARVLRVRSGDRQAYVYFNRAAPLGATIASATLRLYYAETWTGTRTLTVARTSAGWKASRLDHSNRPGADTATNVPVSAPAGPAGTVVEFDVTALLQGVSNGAPWYGFRVISSSATDAALGSANGLSAYRPTLTVEWTEAPAAPTTLSPDAGNAVSDRSPTVRFDFTDNLGDTALDAVQVQVNSSDTWGAPLHDTGWVTTTVPELDLGSVAAGSYLLPLTPDLRYWRVRVRDGAGLVSEWSDAATMLYTPLDTLTITNPAASPNDFVLEPTPPITWTYTGTIASWRVQLALASNPSNWLADSGQRTGSATAWTPPSKVLTEAGPYRVRVQVWDAVARESVPDAPDHATATRDFTVSSDAGVTGVTALAASQPTHGKPTVRLAWERATAPDSYVLRRDGKVVAEPLPSEVLVAGTAYQYDDDLAPPWRAHTWTVQAVVNGSASTPQPVSLTLPKARGIWLMDSERGLTVWLAGIEQGTIAQPEEASVFTPVGSRHVVRRVQAQRGYEGSLGGLLVDRLGLTALQAEANLRAMRAEPSRPVALVAGDLTVQVVLGNINITPGPQGTPPQQSASFDFWEAPA